MKTALSVLLRAAEWDAAAGGTVSATFFFKRNGQPDNGLIAALIILAVLAAAALVTAILLRRSMRNRIALQCTGGPLAGQCFHLREGTTKIGRAAECTVRFPEGSRGVSRVHCAVTRTRGSLTIQDLGSSAGTFIPKKGQVSDKPMPIRVGQSFYLGEERNMFTIIHQ